MDQVVTSLPQPHTTSSEAPRLRLEFLDGLRGLAALYVLFHHIAHFAPSTSQPHLKHFLELYTLLFAFGHQAVVVFIVLSGYVLMLPVARTQDGHMPKGVWDYIKRRARRILPPYYAALLLSLLLIGLYSPLHHPPHHTDWDIASPFLSFPAILSHLLLLHNLTSYGYSINPPMWSVALEWQIYFLFPFVLLPLWRRMGLWGPLGFTALLSLTVIRSLLHYPWTAPWMVVAFALGMTGAVINFWQDATTHYLQYKLPWYKLSVIFLGCMLISNNYSIYVINIVIKKLVFLHSILSFSNNDWLTNISMALSTVCFLIACVNTLQREHKLNRILRWLDAPKTVQLGTFSYSIYLVHYPLVGACYFFWWGQFHRESKAWVALLCSAPLIVGLAYLFHLVFERPFMPTHLRKGQAKSLEQIVQQPQVGEASKSISPAQ